jgi:hypothetical protein
MGLENFSLNILVIDLAILYKKFKVPHEYR